MAGLAGPPDTPFSLSARPHSALPSPGSLISLPPSSMPSREHLSNPGPLSATGSSWGLEGRKDGDSRPPDLISPLATASPALWRICQTVGKSRPLGERAGFSFLFKMMQRASNRASLQHPRSNLNVEQMAMGRESFAAQERRLGRFD